MESSSKSHKTNIGGDHGTGDKTPETFQDLLAKLKNLDADSLATFDLAKNVSYTDKPEAGVCPLAWCLARSREGRTLLQSSYALLQRFLICDVNAAPEEGPYKGVTIAWWLAGSPEGIALLQSSAELLQRFLSCDLNVAAEEGPYKGVTVAYWLAATAGGQALLQSNLALPRRFLSCDLNAAAEEGPYTGSVDESPKMPKKPYSQSQ